MYNREPGVEVTHSRPGTHLYTDYAFVKMVRNCGDMILGGKRVGDAASRITIDHLLAVNGRLLVSFTLHALTCDHNTSEATLALKVGWLLLHPPPDAWAKCTF